MSALLERLKLDRMEVSLVPLEGLRPTAAAAAAAPGRIPSIEESLARDWNLRPLKGETGGKSDRAIYIPLNGREALRFGLGPHGLLHNLLFVQAIGALAIITLSILFLSAYAVGWITSPL